MKSSPELHQHYSLLLGLVPPWAVVQVYFNMAEKRVEIDVQWPNEYMVPCSECGKDCHLKDHREERRWRHLDTMQFQTIIKSRVPKSDCLSTVLRPSISHGQVIIAFSKDAESSLKSGSF